MDAENAIYAGTVDNERFAVIVHPTDNSHIGRLEVTDASGEVLLDKEVTVMMGAIFGPDVSDVAQWQADAIIAIDEWYAKHGQTPPQPEGEQPT